MILFPHTMLAKSQKGMASWYGGENSITCTGKLTLKRVPAVAHKTLPIGTWIRIHSPKTKKTIVAIVEEIGRAHV